MVRWGWLQSNPYSFYLINRRLNLPVPIFTIAFYVKSIGAMNRGRIDRVFTNAREAEVPDLYIPKMGTYIS